MMIVPGSAFIPRRGTGGAQVYDVYLSGSYDDTWHDFSVCRQYDAYIIPYGQFALRPQSGSTWAAGFRPTTVTVSGVDIDVFLNGGQIEIYDAESNLIGSGAPEVPITLTWGSDDFDFMSIDGDFDQPLEICSVVWG